MNRLRFLVSLGICLCLLSGCKEKIDVSNIDTRAEVDMGLVLPIGSAHATFADLLSTKTLGENVFLDEEGVVNYRQKFNYKLNFHSIPMQDFSASGQQSCPVPAIISGKQTIEVPITMLFDKMNTDLAQERVDSFLISEATLMSMLTKSNLDELSWDWIDNITLHLGDQFSSPQGHDITIYDKTANNGGFGKPIFTKVKDFSLCFMQNRDLDPTKNTLDEYNSNVINTWDFSATIALTVPQGQSFTPSDGSLTFQYSFILDKFNAVWGFFKPSKELDVKDSIVLTDQLDLWKHFAKAYFPFDRPSIHIDVNTSISAKVQLVIDEIYMKEKAESEPVYATFDGSHQGQYNYDDLIGLNPATIGQRTTYTAIIDSSVHRGKYDRCYSISPNICYYKFHVAPSDAQHHPQMRLVNDENPMDLNINMYFPFSLRPGLNVEYTELKEDVNFTAVALDSLLAKVNEVEEVKRADLNLYFHATNTIPLDIKGMARFIDAEGNDLNILKDTLTFKANDTTSYVIKVNEKDFDRIASTKQLLITAIGSDQSISDQPELYPIKVKGDNGLKLFIGFAGNIDAVLNFNKNTKK